MFSFLLNNVGTILTGLVLILVVGLVVRSMIRDKRSGKSSCGGNCGACGACHSAGCKSINGSNRIGNR